MFSFVLTWKVVDFIWLSLKYFLPEHTRKLISVGEYPIKWACFQDTPHDNVWFFFRPRLYANWSETWWQWFWHRQWDVGASQPWPCVQSLFRRWRGSEWRTTGLGETTGEEQENWYVMRFLADYKIWFFCGNIICALFIPLR